MKNDEKFELNIREANRYVVDVWVSTSTDFEITQAVRNAITLILIGSEVLDVITSTTGALREAMEAAVLLRDHRADVNDYVIDHTDNEIRTFLRFAISEAGVQNKAHNISASISDITHDAFVERAELVLDNLIIQKTWAETHDVTSLVESSDVDARLSCRYRIQDTLGAAVTARGMSQIITDAINEVVLLPRWNDDEVVERIVPPVQERTKNIARWQLPYDLQVASTYDVRAQVNDIAPHNFNRGSVAGIIRDVVDETIRSFSNNDEVDRVELMSAQDQIWYSTRYECCSEICKTCDDYITYDFYDEIRKDMGVGLEDRSAVVSVIANEVTRVTLDYLNNALNYDTAVIERAELVRNASSDTWRFSRHAVYMEIENDSIVGFLARYTVKQEITNNFPMQVRLGWNDEIQRAINETIQRAMGYGK